MVITTPEEEIPIRVGFIGLSKTPSWASYAHLPYLQSSLGRRHFKIVALCNSSVSAAEAAIAAHGLDAGSTKAYGSPDDLARDPDVDLVVVCVKAPLHASVARPFLEAWGQRAPATEGSSNNDSSSGTDGKMLFLEYPLGANVAESRSLVELAEAHGVPQTDVACGIEEAYDGCVNKVREVVAEGLIGRVVHVSVDACAYPLAGRVMEKNAYALERANGASFNGPSHLLNAITYALGPLAAHWSRGLNLTPDVDIVANDDNARVLRRVTKDTNDHTVFAGQFEAPAGQQQSAAFPGASFTGAIRTDPKWPGEPTILWRIVGEKGQLKVSVPDNMAPEFSNGTTLEHFDYQSGEMKKIEWRRGGEDDEDEDEKILASLPGASRSIGRTYEAFAKGKHVGVADWKSALKFHEFMDGFLS